MRRPMVTFLLLLTAGVIALGLFVDRRADLREASAEARFPPLGQLVDVDGRKVHVVVKGEGPDLVVIHGAGGNIRDMELALGEHLTQSYRVFFVDRPGHGWTDRFDHQTAFTTEAESLALQAKVLSAAVTQLGATDPIVLGHSYGGAVAMAWGLDQPASALVIVSGVTLPWPGDINITYRILGSALGSALLAPIVSAFISDAYVENAANGTFAPQSAPPDYVNRTGVAMAIRTESLRANNRMVRTLRPQIVDQSKRYDEITLPIELLHGTADTSVYLTVHAGPLSERLENARLTPLDGIGHMAHHTSPDQIKAAVDRAAERAGK